MADVEPRRGGAQGGGHGWGVGRFAGVLSLCGPFPRRGALLGNLDEVRRLPIFLAAGRDSRRYTADDVCNDLRLLHTAGLSIMLRQYPCGDELSPQMLTDTNRWIIDQLTGGHVCVE